MRWRRSRDDGGRKKPESRVAAAGVRMAGIGRTGSTAGRAGCEGTWCVALLMLSCNLDKVLSALFFGLTRGFNAKLQKIFYHFAFTNLFSFRGGRVK